MLKTFAIVTFLTLFSPTVHAHEFWVEPLNYQVDVGEDVRLDLRVGQMLQGRSYPFLSHKFAQYEVTDEIGIHPLLGNEGNIPSAVYKAKIPGLHVVTYHALPEQLTYDDFAEFAEFVTEEGLPAIIDRHHERGLPKTGFTESYSRNAKALVQVGAINSEHTDKVTGLPFELVALGNPFFERDKLVVQLLWQGVKVESAQVTLFHRNLSGDVVRSTFRTDIDGKVSIPLKNDGTYLLSAVNIEERTVESGQAWHSTWASLSFGRSLGSKP